MQNLLKISLNNIFSDSHNPDRVIFSFSSYKLTDDEKNVLCKGLNFSVKPGLIEYSEFLLPFELLFRDIKREDLCNEDMSVIKARLLDTALTSYQNFSRDREPPENLTSSEFKALKRLSKNKDIVIQKADKGNTVVILDKCSYISAIEEIFNDNSKFSKLDIPTGKEINHIVNLEKRITSELKLLKDKEIIDKSIYKSIKPVGSRPGILYGLGKIHKETRNGIPPFRPILSASGTPTCNLAKFLLKFLTPSTANEFTAIDSFHFAEEISQQDSNLHMASLDVDFLFTNIPLEETIDICVGNLYSDLFSRLSARLVTFLHLKTKFHRSYVLALFINFSVVAAMLPIMATLSVILKSEYANAWEFLHSLGKELKVMMIPPLKNIFYSAITHLNLKISQFLQATTMTLKSR